MENIFENAKFGDRFLTANNKVARFITTTLSADGRQQYFAYVEGEKIPCLLYNADGHFSLNEDFNIVFKCEETIDEEKLDELAKETWTSRMKLASANHVIVMWDNFIDGFKVGYRKATEK